MTEQDDSVHALAVSGEDLAVRLRRAVHERTFTTAPDAHEAAGQAILDLVGELARRGPAARAARR